jgi:hypothetical protein
MAGQFWRSPELLLTLFEHCTVDSICALAGVSPMIRELMRCSQCDSTPCSRIRAHFRNRQQWRSESPRVLYCQLLSEWMYLSPSRITCKYVPLDTDKIFVAYLLQTGVTPPGYVLDEVAEELKSNTSELLYYTIPSLYFFAPRPRRPLGSTYGASEFNSETDYDFD